MLKHNFKILWRSLLQSKATTFINLFGLCFSFLAILIIVQYVYFENSFDSFWKDKERIYRVVSHFERDGEDPYKSAGTVPPVAKLIGKRIPEVEVVARVHQQEPKENILTYSSLKDDEIRSFEETKVYFSDPELFEILDFDWVSQKGQAMLNAPWQAVISNQLKNKLFHDEDPLGKSIAIAGDSTIHYEVVGVFENLPNQSHIKPEVVLSLSSKVKQHPDWDIENHWYWFSFLTYIKVKEQVDPYQLQVKLDEMFQEERGSFYKEHNAEFHLAMQELTAIHLTEGYEGEFEVGGNQTTNGILIAISTLILILACVNYINISTSLSFRRVKEIGIKKTFGVSRTELTSTFLLETTFLVGVSFLLSTVIFPAVLIPFNQLLELNLQPTIYLNTWFWVLSVIAILIISVASGSYPALILSEFGITDSLKGKFEHSIKGMTSRNSILVIQYVIATTLIITTFGVINFIKGIQNRDLGINTEQILVVKTPKERTGAYLSHVNYFKNGINQIPEVQSIDITTALPGGDASWGRRIQLVGSEVSLENSPIIRIVHADEEFEKVYGLDLLAGNSFSSSFNADEYVVINTEAAKLLGVDTNAAIVNRTIRFNYDPQTLMDRRIIGVVSSYQHHAFRDEKLPIAYLLSNSISAPWSEEYFTIKLSTSDLGNNIDKIRKVFISAFSTTPFDYFFLDDFFNDQFRKEEQFSILFSLFSTIAIVISTLGTFALLSFFIIKKRKEMGIRKVLGATSIQIMKLIMSNYFKKILTAAFISLPFAYFCIKYWKESFTIDLITPFWVFVIPIIGILLATLLITVGQILKAVLANPVDTLNDE